MNGPLQQPGQARAWHCDDCTRLTIRLDREREPQSCDHCPDGRIEPQPLRRTTGAPR